MVSPMMGFDMTSPSISNFITDYLPFTQPNHTTRQVYGHIWHLICKLIQFQKIIGHIVQKYTHNGFSHGGI